MKKDLSLLEELNHILDNLSKQKNKSIQDYEDLKKRVLLKFDSQIDHLYKKRDYISEVLSHQEKLKKLKLGVWKKLIKANPWKTIAYIFSMPFIYIMIIPGVIMHVCIEIYQQVCFRIYRIPLVKPKEYFIFDRRNLPQLNWLEKFNCFYCSYYNCLVSYMQEIVGRTERFWCPIKHAKRMPNYHGHYESFVDYSDAKNLRKNWKKLRQFEEFKEKK